MSIKPPTRPDPPPTEASAVPLRTARAWHHLLLALVVFAVALGVRLKNHHDTVTSDYFSDGRGDCRVVMWDSVLYWKRAQAIAEGKLIDNDVFFLAPLYQYALAIPFRLTRVAGAPTPDNESGWRYPVRPALLAQAVLAAFTPVLVYWLAAMLVGPGWALAAGLTAALYKFQIYFDSLLMPTSLVVFLHLLFLCLLMTAGRRRTAPWWAAAGLVLGLCAIGHGTALLLVPVAVGWAWLGQRECAARRRAALSVALLVPLALTIGLVTLHNWLAGRDFVLLTSNAGMNFHIGNSERATGTFTPHEFPFTGAVLRDHIRGVARGPDDPRPSKVSRRIAADAWRFIRENPLAELKLLWKKFRLFFHSIEIGINDNVYFFERFSSVLRWPLPAFGLVAPLGLTGLVFAWRRAPAARPLILTIVAQTAAFVSMFVLGRYRLVTALCLIVLAVIQLRWWVEWLRAGQRRPLLGSLAVLAAAAALVHWPVAGITRERGFGQQYYFLASAYADREQLNQALEALHAALQAGNYDPNDPFSRQADIHYLAAQIHAHRRNFPKMLEHCRAGLAALEKADQNDRTAATRDTLLTGIQLAEQEMRR